jgi:hypothetical protein
MKRETIIKKYFSITLFYYIKNLLNKIKIHISVLIQSY